MDPSVCSLDPVDSSRHPVSGPSPMVSRARLLHVLDQTETARLTLIVAPAGYGKTTLLAEWLHDRAKPGPALRYTLCEMDNDPAHLLQGLILGIHARLLDLTPMADASNPLSYALAQLFQQAAQAAGGPWRLVLDDYHLVANPTVHQAFDTILGLPTLPINMVIASRSQPPLAAIARLRVEGHLSELDEADLRFSPDETQHFLAASGFSLEEAALRRVAERTEGWPAALRLVCQAAQREPRPDLTAILGRIGAERPLFDYLAGQVLDRQSLAVQAFLRRTALLPHLSAELCNAFLDITDASAMLDDLERSHLFFSPLADQPGRCFRYHALFQEFLRRCLEQSEGASAMQNWHRRAAACLLAAAGSVCVDDHAAAVEHLLAAQDWMAAAQTIETLVETLDFGGLPRLEPWLERLPANVLSGRPRLLVALGRMRERQGRYPEALAVLVQAEQAACAAGATDDLEQALRWLAWVRFRQDRYAEAIDLCHRALAALTGEPEAVPPSTLVPDQTAPDPHGGDRPTDPAYGQELARIYNILAVCYANSGNPGRGQQYYRRALQLFRSLGNREREAVVLHNMATMYLSQGLLRETIETEQTSLSILEKLNSYRVCFPLITLGQTYLLRGEFEAARTVLERLLRLADAYQDTPRRGYALYLLGHLHRELGDRVAARRCYQEAWTIAEQIQERFLYFELHQGLARLALDEGDRREARRQGLAALQRARQPVDAQLEG
jgi:LuxR family maltose regulon positive regulatory protein